MKKYILSLAVAVLAAAGFTSCDTTPDADNVVEPGYFTLSAGFVSPAGANNEYAALFNADTIKYGSMRISRGNPSGTLTVIERATSKTVYTEELTLTADRNVQFIKLGGEFDTYSPEKYTTFTVDIAFSTPDEQAKYRAFFNDAPLNEGMFTTNYIPRNELTGRFQLEKIDDGTMVVDRVMTIEPEGTIFFMQLSATEFLAAPAEDEPDPQSDDYKKVRVYYTNTDELTEASYTIKFYAFDAWIYDITQVVAVEGGELEIRAGELSPYFEVYGRTFENTSGGITSLTYDLIAPDGTIIREHDPNMVIVGLWDSNWDVDYFKYMNKFTTFNISFGAIWGASAEEVPALTVPW